LDDRHDAIDLQAGAVAPAAGRKSRPLTGGPDLRARIWRGRHCGRCHERNSKQQATDRHQQASHRHHSGFDEHPFSLDENPFIGCAPEPCHIAGRQLP
jgi:hypothetical protein